MTTAKERFPNRIFRADTPHDVFCAAIVARRLPAGNDVLAINTDYNKDEEHLPDYLECMMMAASVHEWNAVINISGIPANQFHKKPAQTIAEKFDRVRGTIDSIRQLRRLLAPSFGIAANSKDLKSDLQSAVDEIYLNTIQHPEVQAFYKIFPRSRMIHIPHGFDSLQQTELADYNKFFNYKRSRAAFVLDTLKKIALGEDAVPMRKMRFDAAYSFNFPFPDLSEQYVIKNSLNAELMQSLYNSLALPARKYFSALAEECLGKVAILLTQAEDQTPDYPKELELDSYIKFLQELSSREGVETVLIKPHPRTSRNWFEQIIAHIKHNSPNIVPVIVEDYRYLPVEVILSAFDNVVACAGIASSSMRSLKEIYGLRTYYLKNILFVLYANSPQLTGLYREWLKEVEGEFIALDI